MRLWGKDRKSVGFYTSYRTAALLNNRQTVQVYICIIVYFFTRKLFQLVVTANETSGVAKISAFSTNLLIIHCELLIPMGSDLLWDNSNRKLFFWSSRKTRSTQRKFSCGNCSDSSNFQSRRSWSNMSYQFTRKGSERMYQSVSLKFKINIL